MNNRISHRTRRRRLGAVAIAVASLTLVNGMPLAISQTRSMNP